MKTLYKKSIRRLTICLLTTLPLLSSVALSQPNVDLIEQSIVRVVVGGHGTGWVVSPGIIATNWHVTAGTDSFDIRPAGTDDSYVGSLIWSGNSDLDIALINVPGLPLEPFTIHTSDTDRGKQAFTIGFPGLGDTLTGYTNTSVSVYGGTISLIVENAEGVRIIQHTNIVNAGNSGGPLMDECGRVLGLTSWGLEPAGDIPADFIWGSMHVAELATQMDALGIPYEVDNSECVIEGNIVDNSEQQAQLDNLSENTLAQESRLENLAANNNEQQTQLESLTQKIYIWGGGAAALLLITLALALRKPRQQIIQAFEETSRRIKNFSSSDYTSERAAPKPIQNIGGIVLSTTTGDIPTRIELQVKNLQKEPKGTSIGRSDSLVDCVINDASISRRHCRLSINKGLFQVEDLSSSNGTFVNGTQLPPFSPHALKPGDILKIGNTVLMVSGI